MAQKDRPGEKLRRSLSVQLHNLAIDGEYQDFNSRSFYKPEKIEAFKSFIRSSGIRNLPPIICVRRGDLLLIADGWTRILAIRQMIESRELPEDVLIPVDTLEATLSDAEIKALQLSFNSGEPLSMLDQANLFAWQIQYAKEYEGFEGCERGKIVSHIQKVRFPSISVTTINNYLDLLSLPPDVIEFFQDSIISATKVLELFRKYGDRVGDIVRKAIEVVENGAPIKSSDLEAAAEELGAEPKEKRSRRSSNGKVSPKDILTELRETVLSEGILSHDEEEEVFSISFPLEIESKIKGLLGLQDD